MTLPTVPQYAGYLFDLDGTLYLADRLIPGAQETLMRLRARGAKVMYMTNKPLYSVAEYAAKLTRLGIPAGEDDVLTSSVAMASHLAANHRGARVLLLAEDQVRCDLGDACELVADPLQAQIVILSWDRGFTYDKLNLAMQALRHGALWFATNPDVICPMGDGRFAPDCGSLIAAVTACTGRSPDFVAGKPGPGMPEAALRRLGLRPDQCLLVGDRLDTDIACGRDAGLATALVMTGVTDEARLAATDLSQRPTYTLASVAELD